MSQDRWSYRTRLCGALVAFAVTAAGASAQPALYGVTADGDFVRIDISTGQATSLFRAGIAAGGLCYLPSAETFVVLAGSSEPGELTRIELDGTVTAVGPITGLPVGQLKTGGVGHSGDGDTMFVTFGQTGTVLETRIARVDAVGAVLEVSPDLGLGDNDGVVWDESNQRTIVHDYNANDGLPKVAAVTDIFGSPSFVSIADPPSRSNVGDSAVHPEDGRLFVAGYDNQGGMLVEVLQGAYVDIGQFNIGSQVVGIAFGPEPCPADWNNDAVFNTSDFVAYLNDFNAVMSGGSPTYADPDIAPPIGVLNTADFVAYLNAFSDGCD